MQTQERTPHTHQCGMCRKNFTINYNDDDYKSCTVGPKLIQNAMSYLSDDERELLISGTCGVCFDQLFEDDDSEDGTY